VERLEQEIQGPVQELEEEQRVVSLHN